MNENDFSGTSLSPPSSKLYLVPGDGVRTLSHIRSPSEAPFCTNKEGRQLGPGAIAVPGWAGFGGWVALRGVRPAPNSRVALLPWKLETP